MLLAPTLKDLMDVDLAQMVIMEQVMVLMDVTGTALTLA
jgi:hypothetical protein